MRTVSGSVRPPWEAGGQVAGKYAKPLDVIVIGAGFAGLYALHNSWYKDANGRVGQNYPFTATEFYQRTNEIGCASSGVEVVTKYTRRARGA